MCWPLTSVHATTRFRHSVHCVWKLLPLLVLFSVIPPHCPPPPNPLPPLERLPTVSAGAVIAVDSSRSLKHEKISMTTVQLFIHWRTVPLLSPVMRLCASTFRQLAKKGNKKIKEENKETAKKSPTNTPTFHVSIRSIYPAIFPRFFPFNQRLRWL